MNRSQYVIQVLRKDLFGGGNEFTAFVRETPAVYGAKRAKGGRV